MSGPGTLLSEVVNVAMISLVWTDGQPAIGMEYGPGHAPLCCPLCGECLVMIVEAQRGDSTLGWLLFDDAGRCGHILDSAQYAMNVTGTPDAVTVTFEPVPAKETEETHEAETEDPGADRDARSDDVRASRRRVRKTESSGRTQAHRPAAPSAGQEDEGR